MSYGEKFLNHLILGEETNGNDSSDVLFISQITDKMKNLSIQNRTPEK